MSTAQASEEPYPTSLIFTGTGPSGGIPVIGCLISQSPNKCQTCTSSNLRNHRLNTGGAFQIATPSGETKTLLIDCGKTFFSSSLRWFPHHGLRRIDALLLTHAHADAFFGLDDLRSWTLPSKHTDEPAIQEHVDIYCDVYTMKQVEKTFPYLVDKSAATGGGDIPKFVWHVFDPYFGVGSTDQSPSHATSETTNGTNEETSGVKTLQSRRSDASFTIDSIDGLRVTPLPVGHGKIMSTGEPFMCMGYRVGDFSYVSDASSVPDYTTQRMKGSRVVVMDGLKWDPHASHFSIQQGREWVRDNLGVGAQWRSPKTTDQNENGNDRSREGPERTWMVGFAHNVEHEEAGQDCKDWGAGVEGRGMWVRPAWDGLKIGTDGAEIKDGTT